MRDNAYLNKYETQTVKGTFNLEETNTFFNSMIMDIEDEIVINNKSVQYFQYFYEVVDITNSAQTELVKNNGYQYYKLNENEETLFIMDTVKLKYDNHTISKIQQNINDEKYNTKWLIKIKTKDILKTYIFSKIKEARTFKSMNYDDFLNENINASIYEYIDLNIMDRYMFDKLDFYVKYIDITTNSIYFNSTLKQYDPIFDSSVGDPMYLIKNANIQTNNLINGLSDINLYYYQTKPSTNYKFEYYFNLYFKKI